MAFGFGFNKGLGFVWWHKPWVTFQGFMTTFGGKIVSWCKKVFTG